MAKFTFLEVHLDGAQVTANAPFSGSSGVESDETEDAGGLDVGFGEREDTGGNAEADASEGSSVPKLLLAVAAVAVLVVGIRRLLGGSDEEIDRIDV